MKSTLLLAAKATDIPHGDSGLWYVRKTTLTKRTLTPRDGKLTALEPGDYTHLFRWTDDTIYSNPPQGECVMEDTPYELNTHLDFMLRAFGDVLITGLGLGCVTRGCLANPNVKSVTVIEISPDVMKLVAPHMPKDARLKIIEADALEWIKTAPAFDCVWHDIWTDTCQGEPNLAIKHQELLFLTEYIHGLKLQGAWAFPRYLRRLLKTERYGLRVI